MHGVLVHVRMWRVGEGGTALRSWCDTIGEEEWGRERGEEHR